MSSTGIFPSLNFPSRREERRHRHRDRPVRAGRQRGTGGLEEREVGAAKLALGCGSRGYRIISILLFKGNSGRESV